MQTVPDQAAVADQSAKCHEVPLAVGVMLCILEGSHTLKHEACSATPAACLQGSCHISTLGSEPWT